MYKYICFLDKASSPRTGNAREAANYTNQTARSGLLGSKRCLMMARFELAPRKTSALNWRLTVEISLGPLGYVTVRAALGGGPPRYMDQTVHCFLQVFPRCPHGWVGSRGAGHGWARHRSRVARCSRGGDRWRRGVSRGRGRLRPAGPHGTSSSAQPPVSAVARAAKRPPLSRACLYPNASSALVHGSRVPPACGPLPPRSQTIPLLAPIIPSTSETHTVGVPACSAHVDPRKQPCTVRTEN